MSVLALTKLSRSFISSSVGALIVILLSFHSVAHAQVQPGKQAGAGPVHALSLTPAVVLARGIPGQSMKQELSIQNQTGTAFNFEMIAEDVAVRDGKRVFVPAGELPHSIAATAVFSQREVHVEPGQTTSVTVTLTLPQSTSLRAVVAMFHGTDRLTAKGTGVGMTASLGSLITFTASDNFQATPDALQVSLPTATQPLVAEDTLANTGTEPIIPEGVLAIVSDEGKLVGKQPFSPQRLLPGERLPFRAEYAPELTPGHYRAIASFQYEGRTISSTTGFVVPVP